MTPVRRPTIFSPVELYGKINTFPLTGAHVVALLVAVSGLSFALPHVPMPVRGTDTLMEAQDLIYGFSLDSDRIERVLDRAQREFRASTGGAEQDYWMARTHLLSAIYHNRRENKRAAVQELESTFQRIDSALEDGTFSEGLRIKADAHFQMTFARGFTYMIRHGGESRDLALRAYELAPSNVYAALTASGFYLNAPGVAGGNVEEGLRILETLTGRTDLHQSDQFLVHVWLASGYNKVDKTGLALSHFRQAESIYPENQALVELGERIGVN